MKGFVCKRVCVCERGVKYLRVKVSDVELFMYFSSIFILKP